MMRNMYSVQRKPVHLDENRLNTEGIAYQHYVLKNIRLGQQDVIDGKVETAQAVLEEVRRW